VAGRPKVKHHTEVPNSTEKMGWDLKKNKLVVKHINSITRVINIIILSVNKT